MKRIMVLLFIAVVASALSAADVKVAPTQTVVDYLVSRGADAAAIETAKANAPSEALFLAPGAPSMETTAKLLAIVDQKPLDTNSPEYIALGYDPHDRLNSVVFSELTKLMSSDPNDYTSYSMQIGDVIWSVSRSAPDTTYNG